MAVTLTSRERARLKARAHHLEPVVRMGRAGLSEPFIQEVARALGDHQLIKVQVDVDDRDARQAAVEDICARTDSTAVQRVGKVLVLWRPKAEEEDDPRK